MDRAALRETSAFPVGPRRWFDKGAGTELDRFPLLGDAMVKVARALTEGFGGLSTAACEASFKGVAGSRVETLPSRRGRAAVLAIVQAPGWNTSIGVHFDQAFVSTVVEAFFGGAGEDDEMPERDWLSAVESSIANVVAEQVAEAMTAGFAEILPSSFEPEPIRPKPDPRRLGKPAVPVVIATLVLHTMGRMAELDVVIPHAALNAFGDRLTRKAETSRPARDTEWSERLETEVSRTTMRLQASIDLPGMTLRALAELRTGQVLVLPPAAGSKVRLRCGRDELFNCELGQSVGFYTVRVDEPAAAAASSSRKDG